MKEFICKYKSKIIIGAIALAGIMVFHRPLVYIFYGCDGFDFRCLVIGFYPYFWLAHAESVFEGFVNPFSQQPETFGVVFSGLLCFASAIFSSVGSVTGLVWLYNKFIGSKK